MTFSEKILKHYLHAIEKHPKLSDSIYTRWQKKFANQLLAKCRNDIAEKRKRKRRSYAIDVLQCELFEVMEAYANRRYKDAIDEIYDSIAVLLRMAEMIEKEGNNR